MILIDTVEDLYDFLDDMPDAIYCYNITSNITTHIVAKNNNYEYIDKWFEAHKNYKVNDFHIGRGSSSVIVHLEIENDEE